VTSGFTKINTHQRLGVVKMAWIQGQKLQRGKYSVEKVLGQGGFGITYLVKDKQGNPFVIKTLNSYLLRQYNFAKLEQDFLNEALRLAKFRHPHIVRVEEAIQEGDHWCMVMEYIDIKSRWCLCFPEKIGRNWSLIIGQEGMRDF
jgi:serine/threonine protein kinase